MKLFQCNVVVFVVVVSVFAVFTLLSSLSFFICNWNVSQCDIVQLRPVLGPIKAEVIKG